MEETLQHEEAA